MLLFLRAVLRHSNGYGGYEEKIFTLTIGRFVEKLLARRVSSTDTRVSLKQKIAYLKRSDIGEIFGYG